MPLFLSRPLPGRRTHLAWLALAGSAISAPLWADETLPPPVQAIADQGVEIHGSFAAPGGMRGFGASLQGREMAIYLTPDGEHAIVGTLMDSQGNDLTEPQLDQHVRAPLETQTWQALEESHWIQDGDPDAPRIIYTFTDANCPYCKQFWEQSRPWIEAGKVQLRHIMVGILQADSPGKAAALLGADDPSRALYEHSEKGDEIQASAQPREIEEQVYTNNQLFEELGLYATPTSAFQREDDNGSVRIERVQGVPDQERLEEMMGGAR